MVDHDIFSLKTDANTLLSKTIPSDSTKFVLKLFNSWRLTGILIEFDIKASKSDESGVGYYYYTYFLLLSLACFFAYLGLMSRSLILWLT